MTDTRFSPSRAAAIARFDAFLPHCGQRYAELRNTDFGSDRRGVEHGVSGLSPWLAHQTLTEREVVAAARKIDGSDKFVQEVLWRTYWQGWSALRPSVWADFRDAVPGQRDTWLGRDKYQTALAGHTGIACFDAWRAELRDTGYLHNHARMWFASIWVYTLRLPWELGAALFLRELLDGDAASNTLSWRWVAGLHTEGKRYLAQPDNIRRFTDGRFEPTGQLADSVPDDAPAFQAHPAPTPIASTRVPEGARVLALVTSENCAADVLQTVIRAANAEIVGAAGLWHSERLANEPLADAVADFSRASVEAALAGFEVGRPESLRDAAQPESVQHLVAQAKAEQCDAVVVAQTAPGWSRDAVDLLEAACETAGIALVRVQDDWDAELWPLATAGFFGFHKKALKRLDMM